MGSSLPLQGGTVLAKTVSESHAQVSHGFSPGDVVRYNVAEGKWTKAQANNAANAEVAGVVSQVPSSSSFTVVYSGFIELPASFSGISLPALFLSDSVAGGLTGSPPSAIGSVVKPIAIRSSTGTGHLVVNYLGTQIGGSSTVSVDQIQPVGTVMPFAGTVIPDTWLSCNGASYAISDYAELYDKLLNTVAPRAPMHGHVVTLTGTALNSHIAATDIVQFKSNAATAWSGGVYDSNADITGVILSVTSSTAVVQTLPRYNSTTKTFSHPNAVFGTGTGTNTLTGTSAYRFLIAPPTGAITGTVRSGGNAITITTTNITHFNAPDLRGRFALGVNTSAISDAEGDSTYSSAISNSYSLGSFGGQEGTPAATGVASGVNAYVTSGSLNSLISNVPPYVAVQYIIKAKPYTRAAIIGGVDPDYPNLLVGDLRSGIMRGAGVNEDLVFKTNTSTLTSGTERMRLTNGGNLGLGVVSPATKIETNGSVRIGLGNEYQFDSSIKINGESGGSSGYLRFYTNTTERLRIDANGNVGIGTISPDRKLTVASSTAVSTAINIKNSAATSNGLMLECDASANTFVWNYSPTPMLFATSGIERARITANGNIGIGTQSPSDLLHIHRSGSSSHGLRITNTSTGEGVSDGFHLHIGSAGDAYVWQWENQALGFATNNTERMRISADGFVGIAATPTSAYRLSVTGKIYASDDIVAFSDARYKRDISPIADSLNKVRSLVGVLYTDSNGSRKTGLLAQDVQAVLPEAVSTDEAGNLALAYGNLVGLLVQAVKELSTRVEELEKR
jgi:hypothetical protein